MKIIKSIKARFAEFAYNIKVRQLNDEALRQSITSYMAKKFNRKASDFSVTINPTTYYQQGKPHSGKAVHIRLESHCDDYALVHRMGQEAGRKFTLNNSYLVGVFNAARPNVVEHEGTENKPDLPLAVAVNAQKPKMP